MKKSLAAVAPALLAAALALGSFLLCARIFHLPPVAVRVAALVILGTTALALLVAGASAASRAKPTM